MMEMGGEYLAEQKVLATNSLPFSHFSVAHKIQQLYARHAQPED